MIWQCNRKYDGKKCSAPHVDDKAIEQAFIKATNIIITEKKQILADYAAIKTMLFGTENLEKQKAELRQEMDVVSGMIQDAINENARVALNQEDFKRRYESLAKRFDETKAKYDSVCTDIDGRRIRQATVEQFLTDLKKRDELLTEFDAELWHSLVDFATVYDAEDIRVTFKNGKEV